jgi:hypothetical protein
LLEQPDRVVRPAGQVAQVGFLDGGGQGDDPAAWWHAEAGAGGDDGGGVADLFAVEAADPRPGTARRRRGHRRGRAGGGARRCGAHQPATAAGEQRTDPAGAQHDGGDDGDGDADQAA